MHEITLVLDNIRSAYNVGSILRSATAFGIERVAFLGITPHPWLNDDARLPHIARNAHNAIAKTALGAETKIAVSHYRTFADFQADVQMPVYALEQTESATPIYNSRPAFPHALVLGNEVEGVDCEILEVADGHIVIPHSDRKKSLNVAVAAGVALYALSLHTNL